jgi:CRISPR system Cascade subunit CasD
MLSRRDYRTDSAFTIAALALDTAPAPLGRLAEALREPSFVLYAGRKSCPLGLPPDPALVTKPTLRDAFAEYDALRAKHPCCELWTRDGDKDVHFAPAFVDPEGLVAEADVRRRSERRDSIADRRLWRFERREEWTMRLSPPTLAKQEGRA